MLKFLQFYVRWDKFFRRRQPRRARTIRPILECLEDRCVPTTFMVTTNADHGAGSLRQAILSANANPGLDTIDFHLPSKSSANPHPNYIVPTTPLPALTGAVVIDATTDPGYVTQATGLPYVVVNGASTGASNGLTINVSGCTIRGLAIVDWKGDGILIAKASNNDVIQDNSLGAAIGGASGMLHTADGTGIAILGSDASVGGTSGLTRNVIANNSTDGILLSGASNDIFGNYIGVTNGVTADANGAGIVVTGANNTIGGASAGGDSNVISGNKGCGVWITGSGATGNSVADNLIGIDATALTAVGNHGGGVQIKAGASANQVDNNIIPANITFGVDLSDPGTADNVVQGNRIGTNADGTAALGSQVVGVKIENMSAFDTIGGTAVGQGNLISGNTGDGIDSTGSQTADNTIQGNLIGVTLTGNAAIANGGDGIEVFESDFNTIGGAVPGAGNIISGNVKAGVEFDDGSSDNTVLGNLIGTAAGGMAAIPNGNGVVIDFGTNNTIGGTAAADLNVISGNSAVGVRIIDQGSTNNIVENNYIGLDSAGAAALPNLGDGVLIQTGATGNTVTANIISGNGIDGVQFDGAGVKTNTASQNSIGTNASGTAAVPNGNVGASFTNAAADNTVSDNLISGNLYGVSLSGAGTSGNLVQGNNIGTDVTGTLPIANTTAGVQIESGASGNFIGGTDSDDGNVIAGNDATGILITGVGTKGNMVQFNEIGVEADGATPLSNALGITISAGASNNLIGGAVAGNIISGNTQDGIDITGVTTLGNTISANAIYANGGLGIDLGGGITTNAPGALRSGPNHLLNYPILSDGATPGTIDGSLNSQRNATFTIEFFASPTSDDTEAGQGRDYLGSEKVTTGALGNAFFTFAFTPTSFDPYVTATATDAAGDTSEFSPSLDAGLAGAGLTLSARAGVQFTGVVANFGSMDALAQASSFTATIFWGDGQSSSGTIVAGPNGSYAVVGSHTYSSPATVLLIAVQIDDILGSGAMETHGMATVLVGG